MISEPYVQNMNRQSFLKEKQVNYECFENCGSMNFFKCINKESQENGLGSQCKESKRSGGRKSTGRKSG